MSLILLILIIIGVILAVYILVTTREPKVSEKDLVLAVSLSRVMQGLKQKTPVPHDRITQTNLQISVLIREDLDILLTFDNTGLVLAMGLKDKDMASEINNFLMEYHETHEVGSSDLEVVLDQICDLITNLYEKYN